MADRFFTPEPLSPGEFILDGDEAKHLATVRRFASGDRVVLFNGDGREYPAVIREAGKKQVTLQIEAGIEANRERPFPLTIATALPKGDRLDFLIEKLVELGVTRFVPLNCERSVVVAKAEKREKWERAVIEASKQCGRNVLMAVDYPSSWGDFLQRYGVPNYRFVCHTGTNLKPLRLPDENCWIAIGPEGGWTDGELQSATDAGWQVCSLGPRILRMETAAIAACLA